jgi:hypothetical protein
MNKSTKTTSYITAEELSRSFARDHRDYTDDHDIWDQIR